MTAIRAPREADIPALTALRNDVRTQYALLADPRPNTEADVRAWLERRSADPAALFWIVAGEGDVAVGMAQIVSIDARSGHGMFGIAIDPRHRGKGHGRAALRQVLDAARADGRLEKLVLHVATDNAVACELYRSLGFRDVGVHRHHYRAPDGWHDVAVMERFLAHGP